MDSSLVSMIVAILGASSVTALVAGVVNGFINKKKLSADVASVLTTAAGGVVLHLQNDNTRLRAEEVKSRGREMRQRAAIRKRDEEFRSTLQQHHRWDVMMVEKLREAGIDVPNPPKLNLPEVAFDYDDDEEITG